MNAFRETFRRTIESFTSELILPPIWDKSESRDLVTIPKQSPDGFEVCLKCMDYGVYPYADGWHGAPWDVTVWKSEELAKELIEFLTSVLNDSELVISYSNNSAYKWVLHYQFEGERIFDETGLLFYNWFGKKTTKSFINRS